ncbi:hypothetical protein [Alicyclobacillus ferrooxydans]|uniref:Uncharacterized protein n=1 Tax=Alicyclobacillus ferrooxydans TaxID=471514 RepID=A0A0N8PMX0_9BACL|nr:hypothetical protein [Alicyclobacillus ferrooxydans]KPV39901.1 hypothetical protein AN477_22050 [Alicyclobacillus ferrooxydans]
MKRSIGYATVLAYVGAILIVGAYYPGMDAHLDGVRAFHAIWHLMIFVGAALLIYGLETLRTYAKRHRRMTM